MRNLNLLKSVCQDIIGDPSLAPVKDAKGNIVTTFCNIACQRALNAFAYHGLDGKMANEMCDTMDTSKDFFNVAPEIAATYASQGILVIAAHKYEGHGHVAVVYPSPKLVFSGHWGINCPLVANVGKEQKIEGANFAFPITDTPPAYYALG